MLSEESLTISEFCAAEKLSRSLLYRSWREGWGPRFHLVGTHRRISPEARREWRQAREAAADGFAHIRDVAKPIIEKLADNVRLRGE